MEGILIMKKVIQEASGADITANELLKENIKLNITDFGAKAGGSPVLNTKAVNSAIEAAAVLGGGTVVIPEGEFKCYTICLKSNVNLYMSKGALVRAARTDIANSYETQEGEGGNYNEPEINLYAGLQDHGHSYFANSLFYASDEKNIMIYGEGVIDGSYTDENGYLRYALMGGDPFENTYRDKPGHKGTWFGNKAIALVRCENIVLKDFSLVIGGHFAIIAEGVKNMLTENVLVDTTRDAFDIDCCENVTVRNSVFNSLTDDAIVLKASYGAGIFMPLKNVLIDNCTVSGFDAGSVYAGEYTCDKLIATDRCGPTARVKLGTESTCGYELVTIQNVHFNRSRGFALEAVDGADLKNIIFRNCTMEDVSSSPIFIKIGDRGRFPVTGNSMEALVSASDNVRLDNTNWVLPATKDYSVYPAKRYTPSYNKDTEVSVDGKSFFKIVNSKEPARINPNNFYEENGRYFALKFDESLRKYIPDMTKKISESELFLYANANGSKSVAKVENILIHDITVKNADPRYPVILMGLEDSHIKNVELKNIDIEYRGGIELEHAVEQRQLNTKWEYSQFGTEPAVQVLPWLVNTFFLKDEGLLPRADWDNEQGKWVASPYNVPELPAVYPEPSNWGILPAYGLYARHIDGLSLENVCMKWLTRDGRPMLVFDDARDIKLVNVTGSIAEDIPQVVTVKNNYKRPTHLEYIKDYPYHVTEVKELTIHNKKDEELDVREVTVNAPAPGTPKDSLYSYPTAAIPENGYNFKIPTEEYKLPLTVYRPFFVPIKPIEVYIGEEVRFTVRLRYPAFETSEKQAGNHIYNERIKQRDYTVTSTDVPQITVLPVEMPINAGFDDESNVFTWKTYVEGEFKIVFSATDGILPIKNMDVFIRVKSRQNA